MNLLEAGGATTRDPRPVRSGIDPNRPRFSILVALLVAAPFGALLGAPVARPSRPAAAPLQVRAGRLWLAGSPVQLRGVRYNPWLPTAGPDGFRPSLRHDLVGQDLDDIRELGANAIEVFGAPAWVVDEAARRGLVTLYGFDIDWSDASAAAFDRQADAIVTAVGSLGGHPGIGMWLLGREVPARVVNQLGRGEVERRLDRLALRIKAMDPARPTGHASWPPTADLDLEAFDVACFDLSPAPAAAGLARGGVQSYLRDVLAPRAHGRPLLVTGFGSGAGEKSEIRQASEVAETWSGISGSATAGGFLAEWADGSWGGVSRAGTAEPRLESDLARHDASEIADPVEHNGLVRADRRPKPSLAAVRRMWGAKVRSSDPWVPLAGFSLLSFALFWPRRRLSPSALALALFCTLCWASLGPCNFAGASTVPDRASAARP